MPGDQASEAPHVPEPRPPGAKPHPRHGLTSLADAVLLPAPSATEAGTGHFATRGAVVMIEGSAEEMLRAAGRMQRSAREEAGLDWRLQVGGEAPERAVRLRLADGPWTAVDAYELVITPAGVDIRGGTSAGLFYGVMTLTQLLRQSPARLPSGTIRDEPRFPVRGVMLDVSRNKVPKLETLFMLVEELAEWKINHLQLYVEHTFAYRGHEDVWALSSPLTGDDMVALGAHCRANFIDLVPNQNSFGHLHRWLERPGYSHLAECERWVNPWGRTVEGPFSLCPTDPASLDFLRGLYDQLLPHFDSRYFNIGCDETWDVGQGRSEDECKRLGRGRVYLDFLLAVHRLVREHGRTAMAWGDIIVGHPELVPELPDDLVLLAWGYEADHPFERDCTLLAEAGREFMVCPGTSSWNALTGRTDNCLGNLKAAADAGLRHGAMGYLITDWGDRGHWQPLALSYLGFSAGADHAWSGSGRPRAELPEVLDLHVFRDRAGRLGRGAMELGDAYLHAGPTIHNGTSLFYLLHDPLAEGTNEGREGVHPQALERTAEHLTRAADTLGEACSQRFDGALLAAEFGWAARLARHACSRGLLPWCDTRQERLRLASELRMLAGELQDLWLARNRPGGMSDSVGALTMRAAEYL